MSRLDIDINAIMKLLIEAGVPDAIESEDTKTVVVAEKKEAPVKPKRCQNEGCKTKLVLSDFACRCSQYYCSSHRASELHKCTYDYKTVGKDALTKQNPAIVADKLERI
jgi:hypothetical protein